MRQLLKFLGIVLAFFMVSLSTIALWVSINGIPDKMNFPPDVVIEPDSIGSHQEEHLSGLGSPNSYSTNGPEMVFEDQSHLRFQSLSASLADRSIYNSLDFTLLD